MALVILLSNAVAPAHAQSGKLLPVSATILEERSVAPKRKLILWMPNPTKNEQVAGPDDPYTCPDFTRGSYYSGEVRVSLVDTSANHLINTLEVKGFDIDGPNTEMDLPYLIRSGYYYEVPNGSPDVERKPRIMALKDYNGDGKSHEFALFDAQACMGLGTTLIGYSERSNRVIQYPIQVSDHEGTTTMHWFDYLFSKKPISPRRWKYEIDYRGRGGTLDKFDIKYDSRNETFIARIKRES